MLRVHACAEGLTGYSDARYGVSFGVPEGWSAVPQELADGRRLVLASDPKDESSKNLPALEAPLVGFINK